MNPIDELKELEARRSEVMDQIHNSKVAKTEIKHFDMYEAETYRRLALEVAEKFEAMSRVFDIQLPVIFSPSDPRVVVGQEYEFSNNYTFEAPAKVLKGILEECLVHFERPFCLEHNFGRFVFIRELTKGDRGE